MDPKEVLFKGRRKYFLLCVTLVILYLFVTSQKCCMTSFAWIRESVRPNPTSPPAPVRPLFRLTMESCHFGRLGNFLFQFASMVGVAMSNGLTPTLPANCPTIATFTCNLSTAPVNRPTWKHLGEKYDCAFDKSVTSLRNATQDYVLRGYRQSWKYFRGQEARVRHLLRLNKSVSHQAGELLSRVVGLANNRSDVVRVAIHVRRGDMTHPNLKEYGYTLATPEYFLNAMNYFRGKFAHCVFIVFSDTPTWAKKHIQGHNVRHSESGSAITDFAAMTLCDHVIISVGSFGWWGAWLAGGETIYYKDWPKPNTTLDRQVIKGDYFPPHWTAMN